MYPSALTCPSAPGTPLDGSLPALIELCGLRASHFHSGWLCQILFGATDTEFHFFCSEAPLGSCGAMGVAISLRFNYVNFTPNSPISETEYSDSSISQPTCPPVTPKIPEGSVLMRMITPRGSFSIAFTLVCLGSHQRKNWIFNVIKEALEQSSSIQTPPFHQISLPLKLMDC